MHWVVVVVLGLFKKVNDFFEHFLHFDFTNRNTAYFGLLELCKPQPGETVVVSGAAGAVGCLVGQIAKIKGCKVIGIAGGIEKCNWLITELGFDQAVDYKNDKFDENLAAACPDGVDIYFDNVGGMISYQVMKSMNQFGRISISGSISSYNLDPSHVPKGNAFVDLILHVLSCPFT